jgi:hypothetical protein
MLKLLLGTALSFFAASTLAAQAEDPLLWKSAQPTGWVTSGEQCFATIRMETIRGKQLRYYNPMECKTPNIHNYVSMSWPLDGPVVNMGSYREARHVRIMPNRHIKLY